ncbi:MAG TPA: CHAT domain-containing protein [Blastocatellia bacterium]|nr:CHAT domain-containing protein [Blastocatellia bacterium]
MRQLNHSIRVGFAVWLSVLCVCRPPAVHSQSPAQTNREQTQATAAQLLAAGEELARRNTTDARRAALAKFEEAVALYRALDEPRGLAFTLHALVNTRMALGERRTLLPLLQEILPPARAAGEPMLEWDVLKTLGAVHHALNESRQGAEWLEQALVVVRTLKQPAQEALTYQMLGTAAAGSGDRQRALECYQQALARWQALGRQSETALLLSYLGRTYEALGEKQKAIEHLLRALPGLRATDEREEEFSALLWLGAAYDSLYEKQPAAEHYRRALTLRQAHPNPDGPAEQARELSYCYDGLGDYPQALMHLQLALKEYEAKQNMRGRATTLRSLGLLYEKMGRRREAADHFGRALPLFRLGAGRHLYARALANYGKALAEVGEYDKAHEHLTEALTLTRKSGERFFELLALYGLAVAERGRGNPAAAQTAIETALAQIEEIRGDFYQPELRSAGYSRAAELYELALDLRVLQSDAAGAFALSERARARTLLELLAEAHIELRRSLAPEWQTRERDVLARLTAVQKQLIQTRLEVKPDASKLTVLQAELKQAEQAHAEFERETRRQYPRYAELQYPAPLDAAGARALLDDQTALLEYALGQEHSFLFVVTREGVTAHRLPKAEELGALVRQLRQTLQQPGRREFGEYTRTARRLYELLIAPAESVLVNKRRLLIAPDQALHYLPFECLLTGAATNPAAGFASLEYLLKRWEVAYVPSASVLASLRQRKREPQSNAKQFVAFADPLYPAAGATNNPAAQRSLFAGQERLELQRLPESEREARRIAQLYPAEQVGLYLGAAAKEENVKANAALATARRLHFATHGTLDEHQPQYSGLVLALDDDPREDGLLQVHEIFNLKLSADLVVLSACRTGLGQELRGEGVIGLTRAFLFAGAPSVAVSLWQVADASTAELMVGFYRQLEPRNDKAAALRRAKLALLAQPRYSHPYYWAPFVLVGDP